MNLLAKELREIVVQKYIENPLLIDGRKFDIRAYMIVVCMKPYLVLYQPGYVRMSLNPYTTENFAKDKITHLTNNSVQKNHPDYKNLKEKSIISIDSLVENIIAMGKIQSKEEYGVKVDKKIQEIMSLIFTVIKDKLDRKFGCFELFGFDFLLDDNLNPYLIEINTNPAIYTDTQVQKDLLPKLVEDIVKMSLAVHPYGKLEGTEEVQ
jgi:tubulin--tyrosine ligase like protein 10